MSINIEEIKTKIDSAFSKIAKNKWRYFHRKSTYNFIFHLNNIDKHRDKEKILEIIYNYLIEIERLEEVVDIQYSQYLFSEYIGEIAPIYENELGFRPIFASKALIIFVPMLIILLIVIYEYPFIFYSVVIFLVLFLMKKLLKLSEHKVYGFGF